ncbi:hypothetical protein [Stutzerimonas stutzeri]|uniref:hypothetical protein n=1 Tax=Stutzerimonas stutzeri TaxID=316 RepID=UPI00210A6AB5|nr:hypothetical protein [Stutzerimonas stutzeri]MCQ4227305.1 hypothetical protein [Stutzerimonas stutzeri]
MSDPVNEMAALDAIRELVGAVISLDKPVYQFRMNDACQATAEPTELERHFRTPLVWCRHYRVGTGTCAYLDAFWVAYDEVGVESSPIGVVSYNENLDRYFSTEETFNKLVVSIRKRLVDSRVLEFAVDQSAVLFKLSASIPVLGSVIAAALSAQAQKAHGTCEHAERPR